jgi:hypothetical protein
MRIRSISNIFSFIEVVTGDRKLQGLLSPASARVKYLHNTAQVVSKSEI